MSRSPVVSELYKDKIEIVLDNRQIFYLFFGGSVIVGLVFVLGVMVGRRVEVRGRLDLAHSQGNIDPLAALDRLAGGTGLSFQGALRSANSPMNGVGNAPPSRGESSPSDSDVNSKSSLSAAEKPAHQGVPGDTLDGKNAGTAEDKKSAGQKSDALKSDSKNVDEVSADDKHADRKKTDDKQAEVKKTDDKKTDDKKGDAKRTDDKQVEAKKTEDKGVEDKKAETKKADDKKGDLKKTDEKKTESKAKFALQLSSFQSRSEAEAYLSQVKANGFGAYITEASVDGKTYFRVRIGNYRSLDAANGVKAELEKAMKKSATVMKL